MRVLVVDISSDIATTFSALRAKGYSIDLANSGEEAISLARHYGYSVILLNLQLPDLNDSEVIRRLRAARVDVPVLAVSPSMRVEPKVAALTAGADDVVTLPIDNAELLARISALVRRTRGHSQSLLNVGPVSVCLETHAVTVNGVAVALTGKETAILELLMLRRNIPLDKEVFLNHLYGGADGGPEAKIIDVFICKIRKKLAFAGAPDVITTVWGRGYTIRSIHRDHEHAPARPSFIPAQPLEVAL